MYKCSTKTHTASLADIEIIIKSWLVKAKDRQSKKPRLIVSTQMYERVVRHSNFQEDLMGQSPSEERPRCEIQQKESNL